MTTETTKPPTPSAKEQQEKPIPGKRFIIALVPAKKKNPPQSPAK